MLGLPITCFSALQRAEIAEIEPPAHARQQHVCFSALQRAEIAEIDDHRALFFVSAIVSVLFNEPKLLKWKRSRVATFLLCCMFQCSSTSRNC